MKNFFILSPTYNDWQSLNKLLLEIDKQIEKIKGNFKVLIINDKSKKSQSLNIKKITTRFC